MRLTAKLLNQLVFAADGFRFQSRTGQWPFGGPTSAPSRSTKLSTDYRGIDERATYLDFWPANDQVLLRPELRWM